MNDFCPDWFGGDAEAAALVADLCYIAHVWDDLVDADKPVTAGAINTAFRTALVSVPTNPFYLRHQTSLAPLIYTGIVGYLTANAMEKSGDEHQLEIAHGLRYAVANVAAFAVSVTNPQDKVVPILQEAWKAWMPERFADYAKEHGYVS